MDGKNLQQNSQLKQDKQVVQCPLPDYDEISWITPELLTRIERYNQTNMKPSRLEHTRRVTEMAIILANRFCYDYHKAKVAAMLHDIAKHYDKPMVQEALKAHGIEDPYLWEVPFLAHGEIGAELSREVFGIEDEDVLNAIRFHTYGRRDMSTLEKIVFIADYIEAGRSFEGVEIARAKAQEDLDEALLFSVAHSMAFLMKMGAVVHPNSLDVYNQLIKEKSRER